MSKKINGSKKVTSFAVLVSLAVGGYFLSRGYTIEPTHPTLANETITKNTRLKDTKEAHLDLGKIAMKDGVKRFSYSFSNDTDQELDLNNLYTSCMCTKAKLVIDGQESPFAGMKGHKSGLMPINPEMKLEPGQKAELIVEFDPNAHGPNATGPITRSVILESNDPNLPQRQFTFAGIVVK